MNAETTNGRGCRKWIDWAASPLGGEEMPPYLRTHLEGCPGCVAERDRVGSEMSRLDAALGEGPAVEGASAEEILASLPTPAWRLRDPRVWIAPTLATSALLAAAVALLHPLPTVLAEGWAPLAVLRQPLETAGELARLLFRGIEASSVAAAPSASGSAWVARVGLLAALAGAAALLLLVRRLDPAAARRRRGAGA